MTFLKRLRELLYYDPETGTFIRKVKRGKFDAGSISGTTSKRDGKIYVSVENKGYMASRLAWFYVYGKWPKKLIDHINRNPSDNRICNLREATKSQNAVNTDRTGSSGVRGVSWCKQTSSWRASIRLSGKCVNLGRFESKTQATLSYNRAARKEYLEFVNLKEVN